MIVSRVFAVIIAAIAVEYIVEGIKISFCSLNPKSLLYTLLLK
jgi:small neutral amino acid transporter SnatA (MarC family)